MSTVSRAALAAQLTGVSALALSAGAWADLNVRVEAGLGHSDNISRLPANEVDDSIGVVGLALDWTERSRRLRADVEVDVSYFDYLDNTFDSEVVGTGNGSLSVGILPDTFHWVVADTFGQALGDPFAPVTPGNREDINYFTTGPDLMLRLGSAGFARLFGRWSATTYENSPLDSQRSSVGASLGRRPSSRTELSLNAVREQVEFDDVGASDYDRDSIFLGYSVDGGRTQLSAEAGYTWLERDAAQRTGSALINLSVIREMSAASSLQLTLGTQLGDAGDALRSALDGSVVGAGQVVATADPFENRLASLLWSLDRNRTAFELGATWNQDRYETQRQFDRSRWVYDARLTRRMTRTVDLQLLASLQQEDFDSVALSTEELRFGAVLNYNGWRTLGLSLRAERYDRSASGAASIDTQGDYTENRVFLTLAYRWPGGQGR